MGGWQVHRYCSALVAGGPWEEEVGDGLAVTTVVVTTVSLV